MVDFLSVNADDSDFKIYFNNPVETVLHLSIDGIDKFDVQLTSLTGQALSFYPSNGSNHLEIDLDSYDNGMYILNILNSEREVIKSAKVFKQ